MLTRKLLVIDDDTFFSSILRDVLTGEALTVHTAATAGEGLRLAREEPMDVVILDQKLPDASGPDLCPLLLETNERTKIIFVTAHPNFENAMAAIRAGAFDYLSKPCDPEQVRLSVERCLRTMALERTESVRAYRTGLESRGLRLIGEEGGLGEAARLARLAATSDAPVLLTGETGTGKSLVARAIHYGSARARGEFIAINCGALPESLIEAELFGYEKGAFTGAASSREGLFEMSEGGSLFLDEIGEMPMLLQTRLLNVLEERVVRRVGGRSFRPVDFRLIAATNADVGEVLGQRRLREDLYYRLNVLRIHIPPLRERTGDLPALVAHFLGGIAGSGGVEALAAGEIERLRAYGWPGNLRELRNVLERACLVQRGGPLRPSELLRPAGAPYPPPETAGAPGAVEEALSLDELEKKAIARAVARTGGNLSRAARELGVSVSTLRRKLPASLPARSK
jgi:DNA-binding NtrC family response regulator